MGMDVETAVAAATALRGIAQTAKQLEATVLAGWPGGWTDPPTPTQARHICETQAELGLHVPDLADEQAWIVAGQIVARIRRSDAEVSL